MPAGLGRNRPPYWSDGHAVRASGYSMIRVGPALLAVLLTTACQPTVRVEAPKDPIVINLNVNIQQEVRVKVDRALAEVLSENERLFCGHGDQAPASLSFPVPFSA